MSIPSTPLRQIDPSGAPVLYGIYGEKEKTPWGAFSRFMVFLFIRENIKHEPARVVLGVTLGKQGNDNALRVTKA